MTNFENPTPQGEGVRRAGGFTNGRRELGDIPRKTKMVHFFKRRASRFWEHLLRRNSLWTTDITFSIRHLDVEEIDEIDKPTKRWPPELRTDAPRRKTPLGGSSAGAHHSGAHFARATDGHKGANKPRTAMRTPNRRLVHCDGCVKSRNGCHQRKERVRVPLTPTLQKLCWKHLGEIRKRIEKIDSPTYCLRRYSYLLS